MNYNRVFLSGTVSKVRRNATLCSFVCTNHRTYITNNQSRTDECPVTVSCGERLKSFTDTLKDGDKILIKGYLKRNMKDERKSLFLVAVEISHYEGEVNSITQVGHAAQGVQSKQITNGILTNFCLASNRRTYKDADSDDYEEETIFLDYVAFNGTAEKVKRFIHKGSMFLVEGRLKHDAWEDKQTKEPRSKLTAVAEFVELGPNPNKDKNSSNGKKGEIMVLADGTIEDTGSDNSVNEEEIPF